MYEYIVEFLVLFLLEVVLGVDNIIFISIIIERLEKKYRNTARIIGLSLAVVFRIILLFFIMMIIHEATDNLFHIGSVGVSARDLILFGGGAFLIYKSSIELVHFFDSTEHQEVSKPKSSFRSVLIQIIFLDIVFSLDSILAAVVITEHIFSIVMAILASIGVMLLVSNYIYNFIKTYPRFKFIAIIFLWLIGLVLVLDSVEIHDIYGVVIKHLVYGIVGLMCVKELFALFIKKS